MRIKWTKCAGRIIETGNRPRFVDFLQFVKGRAKLVNNEFGEDLNSSLSKEREKGKGKDGYGRFPRRVTLAACVNDDKSGQHRDPRRINGTMQSCSVCSSQHGLWRCDKFKGLPHQRQDENSTGTQPLYQVSQWWPLCKEMP